MHSTYSLVNLTRWAAETTTEDIKSYAMMSLYHMLDVSIVFA